MNIYLIIIFTLFRIICRPHCLRQCVISCAIRKASSRVVFKRNSCGLQEQSTYTISLSENQSTNSSSDYSVLKTHRKHE